MSELFSHQFFAFGEVVEEGGVKGFRGFEEDVVDHGFAAFAAVAVDEGFHVVAVRRCEMPGFCGDLRTGFEIDKAHFAVEVEVALPGV